MEPEEQVVNNAHEPGAGPRIPAPDERHQGRQVPDPQQGTKGDHAMGDPAQSSPSEDSCPILAGVNTITPKQALDEADELLA